MLMVLALALLGVLLCGVALAPLPPEEGTIFWYRVALLGMGVYLLLLGTRSRVIIENGLELVVQGPLFRSRALLRSLESVKPGYEGLALHFDDGRVLTAVLVGERSNVSTWFGWPTRGDDTARDLLALAAVARSQDGNSAGESARPSPAARTRLRHIRPPGFRK